MSSDRIITHNVNSLFADRARVLHSEPWLDAIAVESMQALQKSVSVVYSEIALTNSALLVVIWEL